MGKMNAGNWGALINAVPQGMEAEQNMEGKDLQNRYYKDAMVDPASRTNRYFTQQSQQDDAAAGNPQWQSQGRLFDPVRNKLADVYQSAKARMSSFLPGQGQHAMGPASQATVPGQSNVAQSPPGPTASSPMSGGTPGPGMTFPLQSQAQTSGQPFANGGPIPGRTGRSGALRQRKAKPQNNAKPSKQADAAMHPPMERAPQDNQEMGAEGGPPRNTEAQPGSQDPMLADGGAIPGRKRANGGAVDKVPGFKPPAFPKPNPKMVEQDVNNDGQRNRLGRTIKKFADGGSGDKPASGLEPAEPAPESNASHLLKTIGKGVGDFAASVPGRIAATGAALAMDPGGTASDAGMKAGQAVTDWAASPYSAQQTPAAAPKEQGPPKGSETPPPGSAGVRTVGPEEAEYMQRYGTDFKGNPVQKGQQVLVDQELSDPRYAAAMEKLRNNPNADATPTGNGPAGGPPPASGGAPQGPEGAAPAGGATPGPATPPPIDFSQVQLDHHEIPNTSTQEWDQMKQGIVHELVQTGKMGIAQAQMAADNQVSQFQHQNFMQYMQQGIALDRAGNKQGAMAALKTAYNYMPTGHGMQFGLDPQGNIVGVGFDEDTKKPVGAPVMLDQANLNHLLTTYSNPANFQAENISMMEQKRKNLETTQGQVPYMRAHANLAGAQAGYYEGRNQELLDAAHIRADARNAAQRIPPDVSLKVNNALRQSGIMDPNDIFAGTGAAAQLMERGHSQADATAIAGMMYAPGVDPMRRMQFAQRYGIQIADSPPGPANDMYMMGGGIPPR